MLTDDTTPDAEDFSDPGNLRHCLIGQCGAAFNMAKAMNGLERADGWLQITSLLSYSCPDHSPAVRAHEFTKSSRVTGSYLDARGRSHRTAEVTLSCACGDSLGPFPTLGDARSGYVAHLCEHLPAAAS